jgi:hypothetical protein
MSYRGGIYDKTKTMLVALKVYFHKYYKKIGLQLFV